MNVQLPHLPWKENQSHRWGTRVEGNSSCLKKTKQSTLHMLEVSHAPHAACSSIADTNTTGIWPDESVTWRPNNKQAVWQQRFNAHCTRISEPWDLEKFFWKEKGFQGRFERTDKGRRMDRNREFIPDNWSLVRERVLTSGHCTEGWPRFWE